MEPQRKILIVEDEEPLQEAILTKFRTKSEYQVFSAFSAEAALDVYKKNPPLPWWGVVLLVAGSAALGAVVTAGIYEAGKGTKP